MNTSPEFASDMDETLDTIEETAGSDAAEEVSDAVEDIEREGSLTGGLIDILKQKLNPQLEVKGMAMVAENYRRKNSRAVEILEAMGAQEQRALVEKGVLGIELSTWDKIAGMISPSGLLGKTLRQACIGGLKRNLLAKLVPDAWIDDISMLVSQPEVVAMFSTGAVHAKDEATAQLADQTLITFMKKTKWGAKAGAFLLPLAGPEAIPFAEASAEIGNAAATAEPYLRRFPKVRAELQGRRVVTKEQGEEHDRVAEADNVVKLNPMADTINKAVEDEA